MTEIRRIVRKQWINDWTVAGWPGKWYAIKGSPVLNRRTRYTQLAALAGSSAAFRNRSQAMWFICQQEALLALKAAAAALKDAAPPTGEPYPAPPPPDDPLAEWERELLNGLSE